MKQTTIIISMMLFNRDKLRLLRAENEHLRATLVSADDMVTLRNDIEQLTETKRDLHNQLK
jgi:hypothetical protein